MPHMLVGDISLLLDLSPNARFWCHLGLSRNSRFCFCVCSQSLLSRPECINESVSKKEKNK